MPESRIESVGGIRELLFHGQKGGLELFRWCCGLGAPWRVERVGFVQESGRTSVTAGRPATLPRTRPTRPRSGTSPRPCLPTLMRGREGDAPGPDR
jgi:hypothetical protein